MAEFVNVLGRPMLTFTTIVLLSGFAIGLAFGVVGLLSGFCLTSGLRNWTTRGDGVLVRTFALAAGAAVIGAQLLAASGLVDLGKSIYLQPSFSAPLILFGGLIFGYGMVLANACASRALVLLGRGNLRSLVVVVIIGIVTEMTLRGLIAPARLAFLNWTAIAPKAISLPALLTGFGGAGAHIVAGLLFGGALITFALAHAPFRRERWQVAAGVAIGLLIPAAWFATGFLGNDDFNPVPVTSLTFISPIADGVQYIMLSTGSTLNFGIVVVAGVLVGSFATAITSGRFELEGYNSPRHMLRSMSGAALMGAGGAMAYGCSIGQGLTGLSTLGLPSMIGVAGILLGATAALRGPIRVPARAAAAVDEVRMIAHARQRADMGAGSMPHAESRPGADSHRQPAPTAHSPGVAQEANRQCSPEESNSKPPAWAASPSLLAILGLRRARHAARRL